MSKTRSSIRVGDRMYFRPTGQPVEIKKCSHVKDEFTISPAQAGRTIAKHEELVRVRDWELECAEQCGLPPKVAAAVSPEERSRMNQERLEALRGNSPDHDMTHTVPLGFHVKGVSTYYDKDGEVRGQWVKSQVDQDHQLQALISGFEQLTEKLPREPMIPAPKDKMDKDLMCVYPMGDPHIGMYAWAEETKDANFDIEIAERELVEAVDRLVALAPAAETALILNLGDFFHSDNSSNRTNRSGAALDVDSRWAKILAVGVRLMCRVVERALEKHSKVIVRNEIGNHDDHTSLMLSIAMEHHYMNNPRVEIDTTPAKFWYHEFGKTLIGTTHGDTAKLDKLGPIMAVDQKEAWGRTEHRYWYTGHVHHESVKEYPGVVVETFRTLAPKDAWHAHQGYRSRQDMRLDVVHKEFGRVNRHIVGIDQIRK